MTGMSEFKAFDSYVLHMHKLLIFRLRCDGVHAIYVFIYSMFVHLFI